VITIDHKQYFPQKQDILFLWEILFVVYCDHQELFVVNCDHQVVIFPLLWLYAYPSSVEVVVLWVCSYSSSVEVIVVLALYLSLLYRGDCVLALCLAS